MPRGEYRDTGGWVLVDYEGRFRMPMHRSDYEDHGYKPAFEALPLKETQRNGAAKELRRRAS
ncbi:MAG: hypothetical protein RIR33_276 [Pseudomonadota bacterium]|jgi:hypothetical protein